MSAESGVPTFRDAQTGLWAKFDPRQLATEDAFRANPKTVWDWYAFRREMIAKIEPNAGHRALAALFASATLAGSRSSRRTSTACTSARAAKACWRCTATSSRTSGWTAQGVLQRRCWPSRAARPAVAVAATCCARPSYGSARRCRRERWPSAEAAAHDCDLMLVVGTSGVVYPAAGLARTAAGTGRHHQPRGRPSSTTRPMRCCAARRLELLPLFLEE